MDFSIERSKSLIDFLKTALDTSTYVKYPKREYNKIVEEKPTFLTTFREEGCAFWAVRKKKLS
jgi:hypothetical protein